MDHGTKHTVTELKNSLERFHNRLDEEYEFDNQQIKTQVTRNHPRRETPPPPATTTKKTRKRGNSEDSVKDLRGSIGWTSKHILTVPKGKEKNKGTESLFKEIMAEKFPNLGRQVYIQNQEAQ